MPSNPAQGARLRRLWNRLQPIPGGPWLFSRLLGLMVPYTGALGATIVALEPGYCRAVLRERRGVRNHLGSVHAVALVNLGEVVSGLALLVGLPSRVRGIVTHLEVDYLKKARGHLTAEARCTLPEVEEPTEYVVESAIRDADLDEVARIRVRWLLDHKP
ncbi:MAG: hotdog fold domain-containing protein [Gemmatimonadota bacterium]